jgi:hypothetical protein
VELFLAAFRFLDKGSAGELVKLQQLLRPLLGCRRRLSALDSAFVSLLKRREIFTFRHFKLFFFS